MTNELATATLRALRRILRESERSGRRLAAATGLTPSQLLVLQEIERRGQATPTAVASALKFGQATVTNIVDRLSALGYLTRQRGEHDRRQIILHVTVAGRDALNNAPDSLQERFVEGFRKLPQWEQAMILAALGRLGGILGATDEDAAPLIDAGTIDRSVGGSGT